MKQIFNKMTIALFGLMMLGATAVTAQTPSVNMNSYITLTVTQGENISLDFAAVANGTGVRVVSGTFDTTMTVGTNSLGNKLYRAGNGTMRVYGNLKKFYCYNNGTKVTGLDPSNSEALTNLSCARNALSSLDVSALQNLQTLSCGGNNFSTAAIDAIFCALPTRAASDGAVIWPLISSADANHAMVVASNKQNAIAKNWAVQYGSDNAAIPATTGSYSCPTVNMSRYITLTVRAGDSISLGYAAAADGTPIKIVSGTTDITTTASVAGRVRKNYFAQAGTMTIYGDITTFSCEHNRTKLTALDVSNNTSLTTLACGMNSLTSLDVSGLTQLQMLYCNSTGINTLDLTGLTQLEILSLPLTNINSLDLTGLSKLEFLYCNGTSINTLDITDLAKLRRLSIYETPLASRTTALDSLYCSLPDRTGQTLQGVIYPVANSSASNHAALLATNKANATAKNWVVKYSIEGTEIPATTGTYVCGATPPPPPVNMSSYITLTVTAGDSITLNLAADAANTPVKIVSGTMEKTLTVATDYWTSRKNYFAQAGTMTIYGDISKFSCGGNYAKVTAIDPSHNPQLKSLDCAVTSIGTLNLTGLTQLQELYCNNTSINTLDLSGLSQLEKLAIHATPLSSRTTALDSLYCSLPDRTGQTTQGAIYPMTNSSASNHAAALATNKANATAKNWVVKYTLGGAEIPATTGTYACGTTTGVEQLQTNEVAARIYPNPVSDWLTVETDETVETLQLFDLAGKLLLSQTPQSRTHTLDVSALQSGVYMLKVSTAKGTGEYKVVKK